MTGSLDPPGLFRVLVEGGVDFVLIGGVAVAAHGYERATKDLDIVPSPDEANLARLVGALTRIEARELEVGDFRATELPVRFGLDGLRAGGNWALATTKGRLDILQFVDGLLESVDDYDGLRARAVELEFPGVGIVPVVGLDDLVALKAAAGRDQDLLDISALRRLRALSDPTD